MEHEEGIKEFTADFHAHSTLKPFANHRFFEKLKDEEDYQYDLWRPWVRSKSSWLSRLVQRNMDFNSEAHFEAAAEGNVRLVAVSLYPFEREWFKVGRASVLSRVTRGALYYITGFSQRKIKEILQKRPAYFDEYLDDASRLHSSTDVLSEKGGHAYQVVSNYEDLVEGLKNEKLINVMVTVEGVQSFASNIVGQENNFYALRDKGRLNPFHPDYIDFLKWKKDLYDNVKKIKQPKFEHKGKNYELTVPFTVAFGHHFFNYHCGHSPSLSMQVNGIALQQNGAHTDLVKSEELGLDKVAKTLAQHDWKIVGKDGYDLIELLLDSKQGKRILIDTKHMSAEARVDYHTYIKKRHSEGDAIPIICSHTACNSIAETDNTGFDKSFKAGKNYSVVNEKANKDALFSEMELNLYDQEIKDIVDSNGMIGLCMIDSRLAGKTLLSSLNKFVRKYQKNVQKEHDTSPEKEILTEVYCELWLNQMIHILKKGGGENAMKCICIGTDFDGGVNPIDVFRNYASFPDWRHALEAHWEKRIAAPGYDFLFNKARTKKQNRKYFFKPMYDSVDFKEATFGTTPKQRIKEIFSHNLMAFLGVHFKKQP